MYEKVSPYHPDKLCDRIGGALVDLSYEKDNDPKVAIEILLGHNHCHIINETSCHLTKKEVNQIVYRILGHKVKVDYLEVPQDGHLAENQRGEFRCGDNGIFSGYPITPEEQHLTTLAKDIYEKFPYDGKYILDEKKGKIVICQSNASRKQFFSNIKVSAEKVVFNPLGFWTGGEDADTGAINRKLGSDMGRSVTGGGLHGKDLSKADVAVNIYAFLKAQETGEPIQLNCAIGDIYVDNKHYGEIVEIARKYIESVGGFEKFAEWGLIR